MDMLPIRQITFGPKQHWFGYYDKLQIDNENRRVLGMAVDFEHRPIQIQPGPKSHRILTKRLKSDM